MKFDFKIDEGLNSGVQIRTTPKGKVKGAQVDLQALHRKSGYVFGQGGGGWFSEKIPNLSTASIKPGVWTPVRILAEGNRVQTWIDGVQIEDLTTDKIAESGIIALQLHGYPGGKNRDKPAEKILYAAWKDIYIREIK